MSSFTEALVIKTCGERYRWKVADAFAFEVGRLGSGFKIIVEAETGTDGASVPWFLWWKWPPFNGLYDQAVVLHDDLYKKQSLYLSRAVPDAILLDAMTALKVPVFDRTCIYLGVRLGGWWTYRKYRQAAALAAKDVLRG